jgi:hypothetical protein
MPFDNAPETAPSEELSPYERLKILRELVPKSGNQGFGAPVYGASRGGTSACARPAWRDTISQRAWVPAPASTISSAVITSGAPPARRRRRRRSTLPSPGQPVARPRI